MTPREHAADVVGRRRRARDGSWTGAPGRRGRGVGHVHRIMPNKNRVDLENMPDAGYRQGRWTLAVLKALGDETRYAMYRELAASTAPLSAQELAERLGLHAEHRAPAPRPAPRGRPGRRRGRSTAAPSAGPSTSTSSPPARPALGFDPPAHALLAGLLGRAGRARRRRRRRRRRHGRALGRRGRPPHPDPQLPAARSRPSSTGSASSPRSSRGDGTAEGAARIEFLHCPFRELAEAYPELVCNLHRGLCEGVVDAVGGGSVEEFATLYDPEPCHVTVSVGYPDRQ